MQYAGMADSPWHERASALGGVVGGTVRQTATNSRLTEFSSSTFLGQAVVEALAVRYAELAKLTRAAIEKANQLNDADTADLFTNVSRKLDKSLWFLEAHLQG